MALDAAAIAGNIARVRERIAQAAETSQRGADEITLIAVSKTFPAECVRAAHAAGLRHFGENRVQEREGKSTQVADLQATWHFIGHLQSNKVRRAMELFDRVDSVDSIALARKLNEVAAAQNKRIGVLIEVHMGEATKSGVAESDLPGLAETAASLPQLDLLGLMSVPPYSDNPETARPYFQKLRKLRDETTVVIGHSLPVLSMGMSHDFEVAIQEGATEVRIGTGIFGGRF
ncbi:MAG: YggS family pyridoxal phosphate-dependent enzyme [Candidatus Acidiferrales bacterium]